MKQLNDRVTHLLLCALLILGSCVIASAQNAGPNEFPKFEVFAGFSALGENPRAVTFGGLNSDEGYATNTGFEFSAIRNFTRHIGLKADFSAHFKNQSDRVPLTLCTPVCTTATQDFQFKTRVFNFLVGPEFKARNSTRLTPFAHLLAGVAHTSAKFTTSGTAFSLTADRGDTGFALGLGGGLDIRATKRVSFRGQIDYNPIFINDTPTGGTRDFARLSFGILFH